MGKSYTCSLEVRWADLDQLGHVNNVKYLAYAQEARIRFRADCLVSDARDARVIVRRNEIEYLHPVEDLTRPLLVDVGIARIGRTSYVMRHTMRDAGTVYAVADAVMVHFDPETGKGVPLSAEARAELEEYLID